jgi:hypothetical protein
MRNITGYIRLDYERNDENGEALNVYEFYDTITDRRHRWITHTHRV